MEKEQIIVEFTKSKDGISVNFPKDGVEVLDVLIGIGLTLDMITEKTKVDKSVILEDIKKILETMEKDKKEKGEKKNGSK